jgi:hypothetical protein
MTPHPVRRGGVRSSAAVLTVVLTVAASGCGGGDDGSAKDYYSAIDTFCGQVTTAARRVSTDTAAVRRDTSSPAKTRYAAITASLTRFADSTESALGRLEKAKVPKQFSAYQKGTSSGFRTFITTLRDTAASADKNGPKALTELAGKLNAVQLPDPPKDITANAKACASFSPKG